jgi:Tfp pilus assembly protein PilP
VKTILVACVLGVVLGAAPGRAQEKLPLGTHVGDSSPTSGYDDGHRRDPFLALITPKKAPNAPAANRARLGLAGVAVADVVVKGIIQNGHSVIAVLEGPGGRSFIVRSQDRLQDGMVKTIDAEGVVFVERVVDGAGAVHSRDVRKPLRASAEIVR